jgi:hypothetical protein
MYVVHAFYKGVAIFIHKHNLCFYLNMTMITAFLTNYECHIRCFYKTHILITINQYVESNM